MAKHLARALFQSLRGFNTRIEQALRLDPDTFEELPMEVQSAFYTISEEIFRWSPEK